MPKIDYDRDISFKKLAVMAEIEICHGWKTRLSSKLGFNPQTFHSWLVRGIPPERLAQIAEKGYPPESWLVHKEEEDASEDNQARPASPGQGRARSDGWYVQAVRDMLLSGNEHTAVNALKSFIEFLYQKASGETPGWQTIKDQNQELLRRVAELEQKIEAASQARGPAYEDDKSARIGDKDLQGTGDG